MNETGKNILKEKSFAFAIDIVKLYKILAESQKEFIMSKQLMRSGTAVGALVREAQNAESKADFIHKLGIAQKECDESLYWLELLRESKCIERERFEELYNEAIEILKILKSSILTVKKNIHHS